ncbi:hypothetical protein [Pelagibius sp.]|uniref:hypothetical protein n=1 Tax=Pelagibius sp. TaxID=1931238 RepID=UPI003BB16554
MTVVKQPDDADKARQRQDGGPEDRPEKRLFGMKVVVGDIDEVARQNEAAQHQLSPIQKTEYLKQCRRMHQQPCIQSKIKFLHSPPLLTPLCRVPLTTRQLSQALRLDVAASFIDQI